MCDCVLLIFYNSVQHNRDVLPEIYMDPMLCLNHGIVHLHIMATICSASVVCTVHCIYFALLKEFILYGDRK